MKYIKLEEKNYDIYLLKTNKFKTIEISTVLINDFDKNNITKEKFISEYLINSNNKHKNEIELNKEYMELYNPKVSINDFFKDKHLKLFTIKFLNEIYTEKGMNKKTIDFFYDIIFNPNIEDNEFKESNFKVVKKSMESMYMRNEEDSSDMAYFNALSNIQDDLPIKLDIRGNLKDLNNIKRKGLYNYYQNNIKNSKFIVFVCGDYNDETISIIKNNLKDKINKNNYELKTNFEVSNSINKKEIIEESNFNQSIVYIIYKLLDITERERKYVLPILNNILGGSSSKLFNIVREENSLAYYAYSNYNSSNNILYMYAGISNNNYKKCIELMQKELKEIENGSISEKEINSAKESIYSNILRTDDSISNIMADFISSILFDRVMYDQLKKDISTVTKNEIIGLAKKIDLDLIYFLKGEK